MDVVKLYQVDDWIRAYLESWGYEDELLVQKIFNELKRQISKSIAPEDVQNYLDGYVMKYLENKWDINLEGVQKLNYFKMIFLLNNGAKKCQFFREITKEDDAFLTSCFEKEKYLITPDIIPANMFRQSIKTFHPLWKVKKAVVKSIQKMVPTSKKKKQKK